ncbi:hypothetical protein FA15DRAFT_756311 [Coprinopsis marcescibilis]|uniref:Uncharacterized protein n=1 Tax=Coprinopsis marcescibilis TaxID=230819 RepID=A0A5C3KWC8_COPMA|nr:hypothetical protein FA15DRAFT_756311 [Coprinopsis marcescibilis]
MDERAEATKVLLVLSSYYQRTPRSWYLQSFPFVNLKLIPTDSHGTRHWIDSPHEELVEDMGSDDFIIISPNLAALSDDDYQATWTMYKEGRVFAAVTMEIHAFHRCRILLANGRLILRPVTPEMIVECLLASMWCQDELVLHAVENRVPSLLGNPNIQQGDWVLQAATRRNQRLVRIFAERALPCISA